MKILKPFDIELKNTILIEASAGTGKTYTISTIYTRLILKEYKPASILVVTFTEAAAAELKLRIRKRLSQAYTYLNDLDSGVDLENGIEVDHEFFEYLSVGNNKELLRKKLYLKNALKSFDEASILTIHSFCLKMLKENAFESKTLFDMELSTESSLLEKEICFDFFSEHINNLDPLFLKYLNEKNFNPDYLIRKFSHLLSRPDITLVPDKMEFSDIFDEYRTIVKEIHEYVLDKDHEIRDHIQNDPDINKQSYRKNSVENWLEQIKEKLSVNDENSVFKMKEKGDSLYKFTLTRLQEKSKSGMYSGEYEFFILCEKILELDRVFENNILSLEIQYFNYLKYKLSQNKETKGIVFFNDLINDLARALSDKPVENNGHLHSSKRLISAIQEKYHATLIDEFQDTDQTQYSIFAKLFAKRENLFCMIGDPKQAIYGFRGGDIFAYLKAVEDSTEVYTLDKNYRSDPKLVESVNVIFSNKTNPFIYEKIEFYPVKTPEISKNLLKKNGLEFPCCKFLYFRNEDSEIDTDKKGLIKKSWANDNIPSIVAQDLAELLSSETQLGRESVQPSDIAILVRKNDQANRISQALKRHNIPAHIYNNNSVFESKEALEMTDLLYAVLEPGNQGYVKAALITAAFEFSANDIDALSREGNELSKWQAKFKNYQMLWVTHGFIRMIQEIFYSEDAFSRRDTSVDERVLTNFNHLIELLHYAESDQHLSPAYLIKWFKGEQGRALNTSSREELRLETDEPAVTIVTIHKSKGLEWPIVYLPYLWDGQDNLKSKDYCLFHDPEENYREKYDIGSEHIKRARAFASDEIKAEEARLLYVALTRASSRVKILWGRFNSVDKSALANILHGKSLKDDNHMLEDIESIISNGTSGIDIEFYQPGKKKTYYQKSVEDPSKKQDKKGFARVLSRSISQSWKIASFSSLIANTSYKYSDNKEVESSTLARNDIVLKDFPAGAGSGEFFHSLLEDLEFDDTKPNIEALVKTKLSQFGYKVEPWEAVINKATLQILSTPLSTSNKNLVLKNIKSEKRLNELEFFFPIKSINRNSLHDIFKNSLQESPAFQYSDIIQGLDFSSITGFMKGFIDLVFERDDKWYIVDYKSNFLGTSYSDYSYKAMSDAMMDHHYVLQYHIYVVALHKYLMYRKNNYTYDKHFGGVLYLFIRGMGPGIDLSAIQAAKNSCIPGVFFDRPDYSLINQLINDFF